MMRELVSLRSCCSPTSLARLRNARVDRAIGFGFAFKFAQSNLLLIRFRHIALERVDRTLDFFFAGACPVVVAECRFGDARKFFVDSAPALHHLRGGGNDLGMPRSEDRGLVRFGLLRLGILAAQRGDRRGLDRLSDRVRFGRAALQATNIFVAGASFGGGARTCMSCLFSVLSCCSVTSSPLAPRILFCSLKSSTRRALRAARSLNSASRDCRRAAGALACLSLRFEFPLEVDGRDSIGETGGLCWVLRRHRDVNHEGFVGPPRARPGLQNTRRFEDAVFLPGAAEE